MPSKPKVKSVDAFAADYYDRYHAEHAKRLRAERVIRRLRAWLKAHVDAEGRSCVVGSGVAHGAYSLALSELARLSKEKK